ncbi:MarR family winged helix-turn-helix transcriptional regulator [Nonomuraea sp. NEAU-A123]|uniref:MarR family winged helix-turn-helix transcriptional regulator n=1 Tax=Nonomuraea sp. NEAU-A123 TaxID=2839649 RepID=UPI001BE49860|nr:MarR family transcriptional regulator [Nonomuraea sp. NEAU-A123]MBT2224471.1 MarR family transcriptional regulator [Nonomuraea sp. NEAU-A123]
MKHDEVDAMVPRWQDSGLSSSLIAGLELSKRMSRLNMLFESAIKAELADLGLTYAEFDVLAALTRTGPPHRLKPSELSKSLYLTSGGTSNVLQRLTSSGYVERAANTGDARSRWVQLTPEGLRLANTALEASGKAHEEVLAGVPEEAVRQAADALREVLLAVGRRRFR